MSSTTRSFSTMLNEYLTNDLVSESLMKRDWLIQNVEKDNGWKGGTMPVPFYGTKASSIKMGGLTADNDISKHAYVRGTVSGYKEAWGTLRFEHGDLIDHDGKVNEKSFLKILPAQVDEFGDAMKEQMSRMLLSGSSACKITDVTNAATGVVVVDRVERVVLGQKFELPQGGTQIAVYVTAINLNTNEVSLEITSRGSGTVDLTAIAVPVAVGNELYYDGVLAGGVVSTTKAFSSLKKMLLSSANGGYANLYGESKIAYPHLQAINIDGAGLGPNTIKQKIFDAYNQIRQKARGNANTVLMSFKLLGALMAQIEDGSGAGGIGGKGAFKVSAKDEKASLYGWTEIVITSVKGTLKVVAIQEMDDDCILFLDMAALKYYSNGEVIRKRVAPDGKQYYEQRTSDGYFYLLDMCALGELVLHSPTKCGIIYGIPAF